MTRTPGAVRGRVIWGPDTQWPIQLVLVPLGFRPLGEAEPVVTMASDGSFEAHGLVGEYRVDVRSPQGASTVTAVRQNGRSLTSVVVADGEFVDWLEVTVAPR